MVDLVVQEHDNIEQWNDTIHIIAFSKTKEESKLIQSYIDNASVKYLVEVV